MSSSGSMVAWTRGIVKNMVRYRNILETKVYFLETTLLELTEGLDVKNKEKKGIKVGVHAFLLEELAEWLYNLLQ